MDSAETFPSGLRVLVVDADQTSISALERLLLVCRYQVTICHGASHALSLLRSRECLFDIVMSEIHLPGGMNGIQLLEIINGFQMDLPVVMMSEDGRKDVVMKIIMKGACDYLLKPVRLEEVGVIWQHVVRKRRAAAAAAHKLSNFLHCRNSSGKPLMLQQGKESNQSSNFNSHDHDEKDDNEEEDQKEHKNKDVVLASLLKKPRMVWTAELHDQFVAIVNQVGLKNAVPKKILELMNVPALTRENVASHLQKYRLHLRKKKANMQSKFKLEEASDVEHVAGKDCLADYSSSEAYEMAAISDHSNQGINLEDSIHQRVGKQQQSWCYDAEAAMIISSSTMQHHHHGTPAAEILESDQDNWMVMQTLQQNAFRFDMTNDLGGDYEAALIPDHINIAAAAAYVSL